MIYSADPQQLRPRDIPDVNARDLRAIAYFKSWTILEIGGPWSSGLCNSFLLPMLHREHGIRQAIVALGAFHEGYVTAGGSTHVENECATQRHGRTQYNAALRSVMTFRGCEERNAIDIALAACILFATIESLRGHCKVALMHVFSGLRILEEEESKLSKEVSMQSSRHLLRIVLQRLAGQVSEIGHRNFTLGFRAPSNLQNSKSGSLLGAICETTALQRHIQHFFHEQVPKLIRRPVPGGVYTTIAAGLSYFKLLLDRIEVDYKNFLFSASGCIKTSCEDGAILCFNVMFTSLEIIFNIDKTMGEMAPDALSQRFREHMQWSEMYDRTFSKTRASRPDSALSPNNPDCPHEGTTRSTKSQSNRPDEGLRNILPKPAMSLLPPLSMNSGIVPSLFMTAARCRDPVIRRAALRLLKACDRREGPWDSNIAADIASKIIGVEES